MIVLALNVGSSSLKAALFAVTDGIPTELDRIIVENIGGSYDQASSHIRQWISSENHPRPEVIGHRIVHGGERFTEPVILDATTIGQLETLIPLAPLHLPAAIATVRASKKEFPDITHVACFDTAFHATLSRVAYDFGLPASLREQGIRRYGFHGLNCEHVVQTLGSYALGRAVIAHLGSGCSLTAISIGRSVDTTMGLTPTGGVPMATRCGDIDPSVIIHLLQNGHDIANIQTIINKQSGLAGWSGGECDMKTLLTSTDPDAQFAVNAFCTHIAKAIAQMTVTLGGLDTVVFTGGIGQNSTAVREQIISELDYFSPFHSVVVPAGEEQVIARHAAKLASP